jgi:hypothetical protein
MESISNLRRWGARLADPKDYNESLESWPEYRRLVLAALEDLGVNIKATNLKIDQLVSAIHQRIDQVNTSTNARINQLEIKVSVLETRAGMIAAVAAFLVSTMVGIATAAMSYFRK